MAKFSVGEVAVVVSATSINATNIDCEIVEYDPDENPVLHGYWVRIPGTYRQHFSRGPDVWFCREANLRKKKPPKESDDIRETRKKGAPSWDKMMEDLKAKEAV